MEEIKTKLAPQAIGPYSQAIVASNLIFCSGQIALDAETGEVVDGGIVEQTRQVLKNLSAILKEAGSSLQEVVKTEVFLAQMSDFTVMNQIYSESFNTKPYPARFAVEVARLPKDVLIEIGCVAYKK